MEIWDLTTTNAGLVAANASFVNWRGPYLPSIQPDPWGKNYFFDPDYFIGGIKYAAIGSFGANQCCPNAYDSDDVILILPTQ